MMTFERPPTTRPEPAPGATVVSSEWVGEWRTTHWSDGTVWNELLGIRYTPNTSEEIA